jgi:hypothetical protein
MDQPGYDSPPEPDLGSSEFGIGNLESDSFTSSEVRFAGRMGKQSAHDDRAGRDSGIRPRHRSNVRTVATARIQAIAE